MWHIDQRINDRGVPVDLPTVDRAIELVEFARDKANTMLHTLTSGMVSKATGRDDVIEWLATRGITTTTLRKGDMEWLLSQADINSDPIAREVLELRRTAAKTSTAKYAKLKSCTCLDGRVYGLLQFDGAGQTGRWAGRLVQPQNLVRVDDEVEAETVEWLVHLLEDDNTNDEVFDLLELRGPPNLANGDRQEGMATLAWLAKGIRSMFATPKQFLGGDFSNIEGRVNAWLAGETWKLQAFEAYDAGTGPDLYKLAFHKSFNVPVEQVTKPQRQIGKVEELACGYQGGVGAFLTMTQTYLLNLYRMAKAICETAPAQQWDRIAAKHALAMDTHGLDEFHYTAVKIAVTNWRQANPRIVESWAELNDAALNAVANPDYPIAVYGGRVSYVQNGQFLFCQLPSGRVICYPQAHIAEEFIEMIYTGSQWVDADLLLPLELDRLLSQGYVITKRRRRGVRFYGLDDNRRWTRQALYGGFQCENIVQAASCCLLRHTIREAEADGLSIVLTVHDELLNEVEREFGNVDQLAQVMRRRPQWAMGLPIMAKAWEGQRYNK